MKIIDEKGRIFGKINVIDFITIVLIVSIVPMFYFGSELVAFKRPAKNRAVRLEVQIKFPRVIPEVASVISEGDSDGKKDVKGTGFLKKIIINKNSVFFNRVFVFYLYETNSILTTLIPNFLASSFSGNQISMFSL